MSKNRVRQIEGEAIDSTRLNHLHIRYATIDDLETLVQFNCALAKETEGRVLEEERVRRGTRTLLKDAQNGFYLVAEIRNEDVRKTIGQLMVTFEWSDWRNGVFWWIQSVYVPQNWRKKGVFTSLYQSLNSLAKSRNNVVGFRLYVEKDNASAYRVYEKFGLSSTSYRVFEHDFIPPQKG